MAINGAASESGKRQEPVAQVRRGGSMDADATRPDRGANHISIGVNFFDDEKIEPVIYLGYR